MKISLCFLGGAPCPIQHAPSRLITCLCAGACGLGYGIGAHAPDEYFVIEPSRTGVLGLDGAVKSYLDFLEQLSR